MFEAEDADSFIELAVLATLEERMSKRSALQSDSYRNALKFCFLLKCTEVLNIEMKPLDSLHDQRSQHMFETRQSKTLCASIYLTRLSRVHQARGTNMTSWMWGESERTNGIFKEPILTVFYHVFNISESEFRSCFVMTFCYCCLRPRWRHGATRFCRPGPRKQERERECHVLSAQRS